MLIRKALRADIDSVEQIYNKIHDECEAGRLTTGWVRSIYPTRSTAEAALKRGDLYVAVDSGEIVASAIINKTQVDVYEGANWLYNAPDDEVLVLHTLTVSPDCAHRGVGSAFVRYYESLARSLGCTVLRIDTNEKNAAARRLYARLGFREADIVPCVFNGIPGINLVLLEKKL